MRLGKPAYDHLIACVRATPGATIKGRDERFLANTSSDDTGLPSESGSVKAGARSPTFRARSACPVLKAFLQDANGSVAGGSFGGGAFFPRGIVDVAALRAAVECCLIGLVKGRAMFQSSR